MDLGPIEDPFECFGHVCVFMLLLNQNPPQLDSARRLRQVEQVIYCAAL